MPSSVARRERVAVRIEVYEMKLREKVKAAGRRWDSDKRVWHVSMEQVLQLELNGRVAKSSASALSDPAREQPEGGV